MQFSKCFMDDKERAKKIELAELKEKVSTFLYNNFIDFERDKGILIDGVELHPAFFLNKYSIIIDCFRICRPGDPDFDLKIPLYVKDGVKFIPLDLTNQKYCHDVLQAKLPGLGCSLKREVPK